jgi:hypothetical protein
MDKPHAPIFSEHDAEPSLREAIDEFVVHLAERIDLLQDAENDGDLAQLRALGELLSEDAGRLGFPGLSAAAREVTRASAGRQTEMARKALEQATDIARRIRLGHRGSLGI